MKQKWRVHQMKTSDLIKILTKELEDRGDLDVIIWEDDTCQHREINGVTQDTSENAIVING